VTLSYAQDIRKVTKMGQNLNSVLKMFEDGNSTNLSCFLEGASLVMKMLRSRCVLADPALDA
jgi:hypothetical protein